jgi:hypothetical protein
MPELRHVIPSPSLKSVLLSSPQIPAQRGSEQPARTGYKTSVYKTSTTRRRPVPGVLAKPEISRQKMFDRTNVGV